MSVTDGGSGSLGAGSGSVRRPQLRVLHSSSSHLQQRHSHHNQHSSTEGAADDDAGASEHVRLLLVQPSVKGAGAANGGGGGGGGGRSGSAVGGIGSATAADAELALAYRRLSRRILPIVAAVAFLNYIDRTSLAFASVQMTRDVGLSPETFGLGSGVFFVTYCAMQVPSNLLAMRVGAARWLSAIMALWGVAAAAFALVTKPWHFIALRLALGFAEAGSFPAIWLLLSQWYPPGRVSVPFSVLAAAVACSQVVAAPLAAGLLKLDGFLGLRGWQFIFIGEGVPSVLLAAALPWLLPPSPSELEGFSSWLKPQELAALRKDFVERADSLKRTATRPPPPPPPPPPPRGSAGISGGGGDRQDKGDAAATSGVGRSLSPPSRSEERARLVGAVAIMSSPSPPPPPPLAEELPPLALLLQVVRVWQVWWLAAAEVFKGMALNALLAWLPLMVAAMLSKEEAGQGGGAPPLHLAAAAAGHGHGHGEAAAAAAGTGAAAVLLSAVPHSVAAVAALWSGALAQRSGRSFNFVIGPACCAGAALVAFGPMTALASRAAGFAALVVAMASLFVASPHCLALISALTAGGTAAALALPAYNSVSMLGGLAGPWVLGVAVQRWGGFSAGVTVMGCSCFVSAALAAGLRAVMMRTPRGREVVLGGAAAAAAERATAAIAKQLSGGGGGGEAALDAPSPFALAAPSDGGGGGGGGSVELQQQQQQLQQHRSSWRVANGSSPG